MDKSRFTADATGILHPISVDGRADWAFVPNCLPPDWRFPEELWPLLSEAKEQLGTLNGIGTTLPNPYLLLRPLQKREAIASSSLEGTYVTAEQLLLYELNPVEPASASDESADWNEVFNYGRSLDVGKKMLETLPLCNRLIKEMHSVLLTGVRGHNKAPGEFRRWQVQIGSAGRFIPPPPGQIDGLMSDLELFMNQGDSRFEPLVQCYISHYQIESIHPFGDGNGRIGRALLALMIYIKLKHLMPWLYMSPFFERYQDEYFRWLFRISTEGKWHDWIEFCLRGTVIQARDAIRRCRRFLELRNEFHEKVKHVSPSPRSHQIINGLFEHPVITITSIMKEFSVTYPTARTDVYKLVGCGILKELTARRPKAFYADALLGAAYGETESTTPSSSEPEQLS